MQALMNCAEVALVSKARLQKIASVLFFPLLPPDLLVPPTFHLLGYYTKYLTSPEKLEALSPVVTMFPSPCSKMSRTRCAVASEYGTGDPGTYTFVQLGPVTLKKFPLVRHTALGMDSQRYSWKSFFADTPLVICNVAD